MTEWQTLSAGELEQQYSPSSAIGGNYQPYIAQYLQRSADARAWFAAHQADSVRYDLPYGSQPSQRFDLFLPVSQHLPPLVVFIHGGYWQELSKNESHFAAIHAVQAGLAHVVLDYTLAPNATVAQIVDECVMALRHLHANAAVLGFDGHRICIAGSSAGAHLAAMAALQCPFVQAAILVSGIYQLGPLVHTSMNQALGLTAASAQSLSPLRLDVSAFPPSVIAWAELETPQFKLQSQAFAKRVGQDNVLEIPFRNHFDVILDVLNPASELGQRSLKLIHRFSKDPLKPAVHTAISMPKRTIHAPLIVNPAGVNASQYPRPMNVTTDESRAQAVQTTGGAPMVDFAGTSNPYNDYQSIDLLLSLQHPRSQGYDEHCFYVMGQVKELLFKSLHFELHNAQMRLRADDIDGALDTLPRIKAICEYIGNSWNVLSTISPQGFNEFRDSLGTASGQLSFMYRHVEFVLGNKSARLASAFRNMPHVWPAIESALNSPSFYDDAIAYLHRQGCAVDSQALQRDWSTAYVSNDSVEQAWLKVYTNQADHPQLYRLAEGMVAIADALSQYRWRHFVSVQRLIGFKPGTGGTAGVGWLQHVTEHRFFPELWSIRTQF